MAGVDQDDVSPPTAVELFAGAGGMAVALRQEGVRHLLLVDHCRKCVATLRANGFGDAAVCDDVGRAVRSRAWADGEVDLLCGGPPCQPWSEGGKQLGEDDPRDGWRACADAVARIRPRAFLFENAPQLATNEKMRAQREAIVRALSCGGAYDVRVRVDDACLHGLPQRRPRCFVSGRRVDAPPRPPPPPAPPPPSPPPLGAFLAALPPPAPAAAGRKRALREGACALEDAFATCDAEPDRARMRAWGHQLPPSQARAYGRNHTPSDAGGLAKTLVAGAHGPPGGANAVRFADGRSRQFTVREAARLQGFPDDYAFPHARTRALHQIGNAAAVPVVRAQLRALLPPPRPPSTPARPSTPPPPPPPSSPPRPPVTTASRAGARRRGTRSAARASAAGGASGAPAPGC